jgi:hypothetical protein
MDNILIYSATEDNFSIWQRVRLLYRLCRGSQGRKPIQRGQCA